MNKNTTLFGGVLLTLQFEMSADGTVPAAQEIKIRQIPVREYEAGFLLVDDEPALVGFLCGHDKAFALTLQPESFEAALLAGREVNAKGFFSFCLRRTALLQDRAAKEQAAMIGLMAQLPPDKIKLMTEQGMALQKQSRLPTLSPGFVSPPAR